MNIPRSLTIEEFDEVAEALADHNGCGQGEMRDMMMQSAIAVFERYITAEYSGKLIIIAWPTLSDPPTFLGVKAYEANALYVIE